MSLHYFVKRCMDNGFLVSGQHCTEIGFRMCYPSAVQSVESMELLKHEFLAPCVQMPSTSVKKTNKRNLVFWHKRSAYISR